MPPDLKQSQAAVVRRQRVRSIMILVAIVAELMEEYTVLVARVLEHLLHGAPFPRRMRFLMLRSLPFAAQPPTPPAHALRVAVRA
ncbi:unnamed protein product [Urochloa decumbens]|uniref:Uncharacterized protein n=1 Tax=Urochloa decumbens TaxID=240449 RepID=A0ABC9EDD7_9POAL